MISRRLKSEVDGVRGGDDFSFRSKVIRHNCVGDRRYDGVQDLMSRSSETDRFSFGPGNIENPDVRD